MFLNTVINFLIVAGAIFLMISQMYKLKTKFDKPAPAAAPVTRECPLCLSAIPLKAVKCAYCASDLK